MSELVNIVVFSVENGNVKIISIIACEPKHVQINYEILTSFCEENPECNFQMAERNIYVEEE